MMNPSTLTPWSGVGVDVEQGETLENILSKAKLNYTVEKIPLKLEGQIVPGLYGVVRAEDKKFFSVAGENYPITQPDVAFRFFEKFIGNRGEIAAAGKFRDGMFSWLLARCEAGFSLTGDDKVQGYLLFTLPYVVGIGMSVQLMAIREATHVSLPLPLSMKRKGLRLIRHAKQEAVQSDSETIFKKANDGLQEFKVMATAAADMKIADDELDEFFHQSFDLTPADEAWKEHKLIRMSHHAMTAAPGQQTKSCQGTWWGALMAVAYVIDFQSGNSPDTRLYNAWHGWTYTVKARALDLVKHQTATAKGAHETSDSPPTKATKKHPVTEQHRGRRAV